MGNCIKGINKVREISCLHGEDICIGHQLNELVYISSVHWICTDFDQHIICILMAKRQKDFMIMEGFYMQFQ